MIKLLVVEQQPGVREGLRMRLAAEEDITVIGEAPDWQTAQALAASLQPDIVLIDADTPHVDGSAMAQALRALCPQIAVILLSLYDDKPVRQIAADAGAAAFIVKSLPASALLTAIRGIFQTQRIERKGGKDIVQ